MKQKEIYRHPDNILIEELLELIDEVNTSKQLTIRSSFYDKYNSFIIDSYHHERLKRYSISQLSLQLRKHISQKEVISYLVTRYIDGMYLLAQLDNREQGFVP